MKTISIRGKLNAAISVRNGTGRNKLDEIVEAARAGTLGSDGTGNYIRNEKLATGENNVKCNCPGETLP